MVDSGDSHHRVGRQSRIDGRDGESVRSATPYSVKLNFWVKMSAS